MGVMTPWTVHMTMLSLLMVLARTPKVCLPRTALVEDTRLYIEENMRHAEYMPTMGFRTLRYARLNSFSSNEDGGVRGRCLEGRRIGLTGISEGGR